LSSEPSPETVAVAHEVLTPSSRKRSASDQSEEFHIEEPAVKKLRADEDSPKSKEIVAAVPDPTPSFNDERWLLLQRSAALILDHVGFTSASRDALESLCAEADSYATQFLSYVTESMLSARRSVSTPPDFEYALRRSGLTDRLLRPHLNPPVSASNSILSLALDDTREPALSASVVPLGEELSGATDKLSKPYIPKQFPDFPSKHTYKATDVIPLREKDPRKIREQATEAARYGEEALRRLVKVGKGGDHKDVRKASEKSVKHRQKHELWERTMAEFASENTGLNVSSRSIEQEEQSILVDADKRYRRKPVTRTTS